MKVFKRLLLSVVVLTLVLSAAPAAHAGDGEVLTRGTNVAGEVFITGGRPRINFSNLGDCPGGVGATGCWAQVRFKWACEEAWCTFWESSPWYQVPVGQDFYQAPICADGKNKWVVETRLHFTAATTQQWEIWGQGEFVAPAGVYKLIPKFLYNISISAGLRLGTKIMTLWGSNAYSNTETLGESFGFIQGPSSC